MAKFDFCPTQIGAYFKEELVVVMPIYNEAANIESVVKEWQSVFKKRGIRHQMLLVNDGSTDETPAVLDRMEGHQPESLGVVNKFNSGHGPSCRFGYDAAVASQAEWVLQVDSDGQCDPVYFDKFWDARKEADCVFGIRTVRDDGWARMMTSKVCRWSSTLICGMDMVDPNVPYRLIRRQVLEKAIAKVPVAFNIHNVALTYRLKQNPQLRWYYQPIRFRDRQGGVSSINLMNVAKLGMDLLFDLWRLRRAG